MVNILFTHQDPETHVWQGENQKAFGTQESRAKAGSELVRHDADGTFELRRIVHDAASDVASQTMD